MLFPLLWLTAYANKDWLSPTCLSHTPKSLFPISSLTSPVHWRQAHLLSEWRKHALCMFTTSQGPCKGLALAQECIRIVLLICSQKAKDGCVRERRTLLGLVCSTPQFPNCFSVSYLFPQFLSIFLYIMEAFIDRLTATMDNTCR